MTPRPYHDVFSDEASRAAVRHAATRALGRAGWAASLTVLGCALTAMGWLPEEVLIVLLVVLWTVVVHHVSRQLRTLRRVAWLLKLSREAVVGYDYRRQRTTLLWDDVQRVVLNAQGLTIYGRGLACLHVSRSFPGFTDLGHRIVHEAEAHTITVCVDGAPLDTVDLSELTSLLDVPMAD